MALKRDLQLHAVTGNVMVGFEHYCRTRLTPVNCGGRSKRPPRPDSVRRILAGERESRRLLLDIFEHGPELMKHPSVTPRIRSIWNGWRRTGELPEEYGRGAATERRGGIEG